MGKDNTLDAVTLILVIIAAINLVIGGLMNVNFIELILGTIPSLMQVFNVAVGFSGIYMLYKLVK